jgi:hypothetical protein
VDTEVRTRGEIVGKGAAGLLTQQHGCHDHRVTAASFDRWSPHLRASLAFRRFQRDFTILNNYYWGGASTSSAVVGVLRHLSDEDDYRQKLGLTSDRFRRPLGHVASLYSDQVQLSQAWHRRSSLVMLLSAFERYLAAVTALAVTSNPTLTTSPHLLDGLALRKHSVKLAEHDLESLVKGTWSARASAFKRLFGTNLVLARAIGELDTMRASRNEIAHQFGAQLQGSVLTPHAALVVGASRTASAFGEVNVSEKKLLKWFHTVRSTAAAIDEQLLREHIGSYEVAALYLEWEPNPQAFEQACGAKLWVASASLERNARRFLSFALGEAGVTLDYVRSLQAYLGAL